MTDFSDKTILVVGGAGFVGSNLCHKLVDQGPAKLIIVDNLLSSDPCNLPDHPAVDFRFGSIADERVLRALPDDLDYVFHLACYHGNQSSMHDPIADHDNNTLTTLMLFERLKEQKKARQGRLRRRRLRRRRERPMRKLRPRRKMHQSRSITTAPIRSRS